jgi:hypothetical protein
MSSDKTDTVITFYVKNVETAMVNNSTDFDKTNCYLSLQIIETRYMLNNIHYEEKTNNHISSQIIEYKKIVDTLLRNPGPGL